MDFHLSLPFKSNHSKCERKTTIQLKLTILFTTLSLTSFFPSILLHTKNNEVKITFLPLLFFFPHLFPFPSFSFLPTKHSVKEGKERRKRGAKISSAHFYFDIQFRSRAASASRYLGLQLHMYDYYPVRSKF